MTTFTDLARAALLAALSGPCFSASAQQQEPQPPNSELSPTSELLFERLVTRPGSTNIRVAFDHTQFGLDAFVFLSSPTTGDWQRLDAVSIQQWRGRSAIFNGDAVLVQVFVAPGDRVTDVSIARAISYDGVVPVGPIPETVCGADDRIPASDNRVGRLLDCQNSTCACSSSCQLGICTAWRTTNETFLTAGHCTVGSTPDIVEFNVPTSASNGDIILASPSHQYSVDLTSIVDNDHGLGEDWAVFDVFPNSNTQLRPDQAYGVGFRLSRETPVTNAPIRITGFGNDDSSSNSTNQTSVGPYKDEYVGGTNDIDHEYFTDTEGGNSGGPIIWESYGVAIGIHTTSGCLNPFSNFGNAGTSFEVDILQSAIESRWGAPARFVDRGHTLPVNDDGSIYRPFDTLTEGAAACPDNGVVVIVGGSYSAASGNTFTINRPMRLVAVSGSVVIGN